MSRLFHRRCDVTVDALAETADTLTRRAETAEATLDTTKQELDEAQNELMCTEHDLNQANERLRGLKNQFERVLENAYQNGMLYRTWALLRSSLDEDTRPVLENAARTADTPALDEFVKIHNRDGFWGAQNAPERCLDPFCRLETGLIVVRHSAAADGAARMLCTACGRHWGLPRYLASVLDQGRWRPCPAGGRTSLVEEAAEVLEALDAALPPASADLAAAA